MKVGILSADDDGDTGKSFSETLILASTNPQYDKRLFIDLPIQYINLQAPSMLCT